MKTLLNYIGQIRFYSLADLVLLLVALGTGTNQFIGALILHIAFLAYLENKHAHSYRTKIPSWTPWFLAIIGLILYGGIEGFLYILASFLYTRKAKGLGVLSPLFRGLQSFFIIAGIVGYFNLITYVASALFILRNLIGDFRDIEKDRKEGMRTIPVILGLTKNIKHFHLIATIFTSTIWWSISSLSIIWLFVVILIEISTYNLTPR